MNAEHDEDAVELDEHAPPPAARPSKLASWINKKNTAFYGGWDTDGCGHIMGQKEARSTQLGRL